MHFSRRKFLKASLLSGAGLLAHPLLKAQSNANKTIIVIGAGIAGLAAAKKLTNAGHTVIVLEARNRTGGRIRTDRSLGFPVDLGASWIHGPDGGNPITALAQQAGANTYVTDDDSLTVWNADGSEVNDRKFESYYNNADTGKYQVLLEDIEELAANTNDLSIEAAIRQIDSDYLTDPLMLWFLSSYMEFDSGGTIEKLSAQNWDADENFPGDDVLFPNGYDTIINLLATGLDIRLNQVVNTIKYSGAGVEVMTNGGQKITGDYALITLPLGVLKSGSVRFDPVLPAGKTNLINKIEMGMVNKIALQWENSFWPEMLQYMGYANATKGKYTYFLNIKTFAPVNALMTFGFGQFGLTLEDQTDAEIQSDIVAVLKNMFGSSSVPNPNAILVTRWTKDPYARGAYSYNNVGVTIDDFETLSAPVNNKLFFAGEHCSRLYKGTVHGAYLSGQREADRILALASAGLLNTHPISGIEMTCYPNPTTHVVAVRFTGQKKPTDATLLLKDSNGAVVWQENIRISAGGSHEQQISVQSLAKGSYWLEAVMEGGVVITKVVKL